MIARGDIWWADLGELRGSSPAYTRPVLVVQADSFNLSRLSTVVVVGLTRNRRLAEMPGNVLIPAESSNLPDDSVANVTQLATVARADLFDHVGALPPGLMDDVDRGLRMVLSL